ncbi:MAG: 50S ribosomal protein L13 [Candidatus Omnitrophica bacterium]|nr:50S ribosomal protein L13 [Candidatus Omnitrophota bacterium]
MKTFVTKPRPEKREWVLLDAQDQVLGRLATRAAILLRGKDRPTYTPHVDGGRGVVVINAEKIRTTGQKLTQKIYTRYSGYPGGIRRRSLQEMLERFPQRVFEHAVKGMLPNSKMGRRLMTHLRVYVGPEHEQQAQLVVRNQTGTKEEGRRAKDEGQAKMNPKPIASDQQPATSD